MKSSLSKEEPWQKVCILKGQKYLHPPKEIHLPIGHPNGHQLNPNKVADLQKVVQFLPPLCRDFFISLANNPVEYNSYNTNIYQ